MINIEKNSLTKELSPSAEILLGAAVFNQHAEEVAQLLLRVFRESEPWKENSLTIEETRNRVKKYSKRPGFMPILIKVKDSLVAVAWYDTPSVQDKENFNSTTRNAELMRPVVEEYLKRNPDGIIIWAAEMVILPEYQGQGLRFAQKAEEKISKFLWNWFLKEWSNKDPKGALVFARIMSSNERMLDLAQKHGFIPTGIKYEASDLSKSNQNSEAFHEFFVSEIPLNVK